MDFHLITNPLYALFSNLESNLHPLYLPCAGWISWDLLALRLVPHKAPLPLDEEIHPLRLFGRHFESSNPRPSPPPLLSSRQFSSNVGIIGFIPTMGSMPTTADCESYDRLTISLPFHSLSHNPRMRAAHFPMITDPPLNDH